MMVITFMKAKSISCFHIQNRNPKISSQSAGFVGLTHLRAQASARFCL